MKLQNFAIIFALIAIPLILVLTYYIQLQVDTIALQNKYDTALLNALRDAVSSFEINTANEDLSSVSDSLRTIIEASNNVFFNTLSTNLGLSNASKAYAEPYIPAILYTLYDGYYISSPTQVPEVLTDPEERAVAVGDVGVDGYKNNYTYIHATEDEQNKCKVCSTAKLKGENLPHGMQNNVTELQYGDDGVGEDYGQLLYLKEKGNIYKYTTSIDDAQKTTKNVLKTYMPYSARYKSKNSEPFFDITVIYTLDNYITIEGTIREVYYTKSGYLIPKGVIEPQEQDLFNYSQEDAENYIKNNPVSINIKELKDKTTTINSGNEEIELPDGIENKYDQLTKELTELNNRLEDIILNHPENTEQADKIKDDINTVQYELDKMSAVIYYVKAQIFSNWVYNNLIGNTENKDSVNVTEANLVEISNQDYETIKGNEQITYNFTDDQKSIFDTNPPPRKTEKTEEEEADEKLKDLNYLGEIEIPVDSHFYSHKLNVIRNSIQYNLNLAMSVYNEQTSNTYQYEMPIMQSEEWDKILSNVSVVAFMQGYPCKLKTYNNYKIVSSTNNEIAVSPKNIFYVPKENFNDEQSEYHRIDCEKLPASEEYISFSSKEVKYDKTNSTDNSRYLYDHKNFACYDCVNDGNYIERRFNLFSDDTQEGYNKKMAYYIAVGKERNNLYKMNAIDNSHGYEVIYDDRATPNKSGNSSLYIRDIKQIEIVLGTIKTSNIKENLRYDYTIRVGTENIQVGDNFVKPNSISSNESSNITLILNLNPDSFATSGNDKFSFDKSALKDCNLSVTNKNEAQSTTYLNTPGDNVDDDTIFKSAIKYIRVIYK